VPPLADACGALVSDMNPFSRQTHVHVEYVMRYSGRSDSPVCVASRVTTL